MSGVERWLGIDFSGNHLKWLAGCTKSNVWIADVRRDAEGLYLHTVERVQKLPGVGAPFDRLAALLAEGSYVGAGIDAPFSVPDPFVRRVGGHARLLKVVGERTMAGRPFITGAGMVQLVAGSNPPLTPSKPMRATDKFWTERRVNARSPLWTGARPGAPMTAACLTLLHRAGRPIWPWCRSGAGIVAEAFPAGQLASWGLPHESYDGESAAAVAVRTKIVEGLTRWLDLGKWKPTLWGAADALDSVVCAFAAIAAGGGIASAPESRLVATEGWIALHP